MHSLKLNSYAKLNLYLEVLKLRKDNFHNIKTLFERIDLSDRILLKPRRDRKIKIICNDCLVPKGSANLCWRAAKLLQEVFNIESGLDIKIIKRIPVAAGLGGGSSNAASVLLGLNKLWKLGLSRDKLAAIAQKIGSDAPFFVYDRPFALGSARGDKIKPLSGLSSLRFWHILVVPDIAISTPYIYKQWDKKAYCALTRPKYSVNIIISELLKGGIFLKGGFLFNSLEEIALRLYSKVGRIKERLSDLGLKSILMSGSGPAVFGIVSSRKEAVSLSSKLRKEEKSWRIFVTKTV